MSDLPYDPDARRDTPLARKLKAGIRRDGPITVRHYMQACLHDPEHGYYRTKTAIGRDGDFITAPEISQVFGELIGLWCLVVWQQMGSPQQVNLVELGPGRGTLMRDALRAARIVPGFLEAAQIRLIEQNPVLRSLQKAALGSVARELDWQDHATLVPLGPSIVIANEFLDVIPVSQYVRVPPAWVERGVHVDGTGRLAFCTLELRPSLLPQVDGLVTEPGDVIERRQTVDETLSLQRFGKPGPLAALYLDYGHTATAIGDTLQAVRRHRFEHPLTSPGEADLTAHVDFAAFGQEARTSDMATDGPVTQAELLGRLGIVERACRLMSANPAKASEIETGVARLMSPAGMGGRFKAIGIRSAQLPPLPGFPTVDIGSRRK